MATAEELLNSLSNTETYSDDPGIFVINDEDRTIDVPSKERLFGVTGDKDVERKYFQCHKIVGDNIDLSQHQIYISYVFTTSENNTIFPTIGNGRYHCEDVEVSGDNITFSWLLSGNVLSNPGFIAFKVMAMKNEGDELKTKWNTAPAFGTVLITVPDGEDIAEEYPDVINQIFDRLDALESGGGGGTGGTTNYENLSNKPQLNGVTLEGNKTLDQVGVLAKNQGSSNSGKYLSVGSDGNVVPADAPSGGTVDPEQIKQAVNGYLEENPVSGMTEEQEQQLNQNTTDVADLKSAMPKVDSTLSNTGEAADAKATGEALSSKAKNTGWNPEKIIGTDTEGNMIDMDVSQLDIKNLIFKSEDGKKYSVSVDNDGGFTVEEIPEIPSDGLITDLQVVDGKVTNVINGEIYNNYTVNEDETFYGDEVKYGSHVGQNMISKSLTNRSIVCVIDGSDIADTESQKQISFIVGDNYGYFGIEFIPHIIDSKRQNYFRDFGGVFSDVYAYYNNTDNVALIGAKNDSYPYEKSSIFMAESCDYDSKHIVQASFNSYTERDTTGSIAERSGIYLLNNVVTKVKAKRILIYDRAITPNEIDLIREILVGKYSKILNSYTWIDGIEGLGTPTAFESASSVSRDYPKVIETKTEAGSMSMEINGETKEWTNNPWNEPTIEETPTYFTDIFFTNPIEELEISKKYKLEAFPYPYKINDANYTYNIEYTSSEKEKCLCFNGFLIPKGEGNVTITARISNTAIQKQIEIQIVPDKKVEANYMYIDENASNEYGSLKTQNPEMLLRVIFKHIDNAKELGFNGIVFPKMNYHVKPYKTGVLYYVPSDMTVDFSGSNFFVQSSEYGRVNKEEKTDTRYTMFSFGKSTWAAQEGGLYKQCENSVIKNMNYYGERYNTDLEDGDYSEFVNSFYFAAGGTRNCHIENIRFDSTIGFNVSTGHNGFQQYQGTSSDGAVRGCVVTDDLQAGRLNETGTEIIPDDTGMWYCTPEYIKLGYNYSENPAVYTDMKYYTFGTMGTATRPGSSGFWYDIYFYDAEKSLIEYRPYQMALEKYLLPENTVYFKINSTLWGNTNIQSQVDVQHVQRLWCEGAPYMCSVKNCQFINPHASAISVTGGDNFLIENCYAEQGAVFSNPNGAMFGWSIDFEDGWLNMRHCIVYKTLCSGVIPNPGGYDTTYINDVISSLRSSGSAQENINVINCFVGTVNCLSKVNDYFNNVSYSKAFNTSVSSDVSVAGIRTLNCNKIENSNLFAD